MNIRKAAYIACLGTLFTVPVPAQVPVSPAADHAALLASADPKLARNKRLVYDFWREVFEAGHLELAPKYLAETYIQHNPNVPTGRAAFVEFFGKFKQPGPVADRIAAPLVAMTAEGDLVVLSSCARPPTRKTRRRSTRPPRSTCFGSRTERLPSTGTPWPSSNDSVRRWKGGQSS
jgi:predicted SnoaL-like aldol condensation-catalyzing enzyme